MSLDFRVHPEELRQSLHCCPVSASHDLGQSNLFRWQRLRQLAHSLPPATVRVLRGDVGKGTDPLACQMAGTGAVEAMELLATRRLSICFSGIESDPDFGALLDQCLATISMPLQQKTTRVLAPQACLVLSSPHSVHPFHFDATYNLLLQVRGHKTLHIWSPDDRAVLSEEDLDHAFAVMQRLHFDPGMFARAMEWALSPGHGVLVPALSPHLVETGPDLSVTLSVAFHTARSRRQQALHRIHGTLRQWGFDPAPVGTHRNLDDWKYAAFRLARRLEHLRRRRR